MKAPKKSLFVALTLILLATLISCSTPMPQVVKETVKETVVVKETVKETVIVEGTPKVIEKVVTATPLPGEQAKYGGKLVYAINAEGDTLDPAAMVWGVEGIVAQQIYEPLVFYSEDFELVPWLAEKWEMSDDYKEWTFYLREGIKFHDGTPFNAQAVADVYKRYLEPGVATGGVLQYFGPGKFEGAEVVDEYTVKLVFKEPQPNLLLNFYAPMTSAMPSPTAAEKWGEEFGQHPVGTGPFIFKEWVRGDHITLVRNPDYSWAPQELFDHQGPAYLEEIEIRFITEPQTRLVALETGEADLIDRMPFQDVNRLEEDPRFQVLSNWMPGMAGQMGFLNCTKAPTDELLVRQAVNYAANQDQMNELAYFNTMLPSYGPYTANLPEFNPKMQSLFPFDPEKAKALLEEAGWVDTDGDGIREKDGEQLSISIANQQGWSEWVEVLQANLQVVGFDATLEEVTGSAYAEGMARGEWNVSAMGAIFVDVGRLYTWFHSSNFSKGMAGAGNCQNDHLDELLEKLQGTPPSDERTQMAYEIQEIIMDEAMMVPAVSYFFHTGLESNVKGHKSDATTWYHLFYDVYFEGDK